ncbi:MAG TPA: AMP-binding protein [Ilumatobacter sp.]
MHAATAPERAAPSTGAPRAAPPPATGGPPDPWEAMRARLAGLPFHEGVNIAHEAVDRHVADGFGSQPAMRFLAKGDDPDAPGTVYTYQRLAVETARFAHVLRGLGVMPGETVYLLAGRVPRLYVAALGALKGQHLVCPLFAAFGPEPIQQRMLIGKAAVLVTTASLYRRKIAPMRGRLPVRHVIALDVDDQADAPPGTLAFGDLFDRAIGVFGIAPTAPETPALLHFTSGTTGTPKGALHVHDAVAMHHATTGDVFGLGRGDVYWCTADPGWVTGISYGVIGPLTVGATMVVDEAEFDAERWYRILEGQRVDVWYTAPTAIRMLIHAGPERAAGFDLSGLRSAFSVGEPLGAEAVRWGEAHLGITFRDTWWQTETGAVMIANPAGGAVEPGSMGSAVCGVEATLLATTETGEVARDETGRVVELDDPAAIGMIALRAGWPSMFRAYLDDDDRYRRCFADGWYLAGDLARRDRFGRFWFVGRADDVIKTAGHLVGPFEVEAVLNAHPAVSGSGVYGVPDPVAGQVVHARIVLHRGVEAGDATIAEVMAHARRRLGAGLAPREIVAVDRLPVTRSGKVMRRVLRARELGLPEGDLSTLEESTTEGSTR